MTHEMKMGDDNILRIKFSGDFDEAAVDAYVRDFTPLLEAASESRPIHFLVDISQIGKASAGARKIFGGMFRDPDPRIGYTALAGANRYIRVATGFVLRVTGTQTLRMFDSEEEALSWLKSLDATPTDKEVDP